MIHEECYGEFKAGINEQISKIYASNLFCTEQLFFLEIFYCIEAVFAKKNNNISVDAISLIEGKAK